MDELSKARIDELEHENHKLRFATQQWEQLEKSYRKSLEELHESAASMRHLLEKTDKALFGGDLAWWELDYRTGRVIFNENRSRLLGYQPGELPDTYSGITAMIHPDDHDATIAKLQKHLDGHTPNYEAEFRLQTRLGEWRWFFDKGKVVETDILGKPLRLSGVLIDIHERKSTESELIIARDKATADSRAKSNFLASMSHEIYTPMAGVIGMAEILKQSRLNAEQEEYLNVIVKSATNLMSILNDILEFSKIESGRMDFHEKPFSIHQVIEEITASFIDRASEKNIEMISFQDPYIPHEVLGDPVRLRQVLKIFIDNAIKFTRSGHIRVEARFLEWDDNSVRVKFTIADTGIGISEEGLKRLFISFSKLDTTESKQYGGGGLGLAIARKLIERMNGQISVESEPGVGSDFSFTILFDRYLDTETPDRMKELLHGTRILIVDPSAERRSALSGYLERWEAECDVCPDPKEAMQVIFQKAKINKPYSLIIIDYQQTDMTGIEFAASVRHDHTVQKSIILLSAHKGLEISSTELSVAGVAALLGQPYTISRLKTRLKEAITNSHRDPEGTVAEDFQPDEEQRKMLHILLAEDNLINQKVALVTLEKIGHKTDLAVNGAIAVEMFSKGNYDLILMDIKMPEMDGLEAARLIRAWEADHPEREPVHICAITANRSEEDESKCYQAGMNSYISKPFRLEELTRILSHI